MPLHLDIQPKDPRDEPKTEPKPNFDFELELDENNQKSEIPSVTPRQSDQPTPESKAIAQKSEELDQDQNKSEEMMFEKPGLNWEYQGYENQKAKEKPVINFWTVLWSIIRFILITVVVFGAIFIIVLFIVGNFYDPVPATLKAIQYTGIVGGIFAIYVIYLFLKRKFLEASAFILGIISVLAVFFLGYIYYKNNQTMPLLETLLSWFGL
ncbi:MAG: hypothetical protein ABH837_01035 [bacterium]